MWGPGRIKLVVALLVLGGVTAAVLVAMSAIDKMDKKICRTKSEDNIRSMITLMVGSGRSTPDDYPRLSGRNSILSFVASGQWKPSNLRDLEVLWPPSIVEQSRKIDPRAYEQVTWASLKTRRFPHLTGYAGPSKSESPTFPHDGEMGTPWVADLTDPDGIIVGFSSGSVRFMTWEELGVDPPEGPVVVGPKAKHPLLRALSSE